MRISGNIIYSAIDWNEDLDRLLDLGKLQDDLLMVEYANFDPIRRLFVDWTHYPDDFSGEKVGQGYFLIELMQEDEGKYPLISWRANTLSELKLVIKNIDTWLSNQSE